MGWGTTDIPDQTGRVAVVTGANGGLGLESAKALAAKGAHVVMAARNQDKAKTAHDAILAEVPNASLEVLALDLASLESVKAFAADVVERHPVVDRLINNAGVMGTPRFETVEGFELQFGTNHLGHFALTAKLMPSLLRSKAARVVTVTSTARHMGKPIDPSDPHLTADYDPWRAYGHSKLANLHFAVELDRRLRAAGAPVASLVAHPGFSNTDLQSTSAKSAGGRSHRFFEAAVTKVGMSAERGALPQLRAATDPGANGGELYAPRFVNNGVPVRRPIMGRSAKDADLRSLWVISEKETGVAFDVAAMTRASRES